MTLEIVALDLGRLVNFSQASLTFQRGHDRKATVSIIMFVILGAEHPIVVDTGTGTVKQTRERHNFTLERSREQEPLEALKRIGVDPNEVRTVVNTHLHWDHCSNNHLFPHADVIVQKDEMAYAVDPLPPSRFSYERHSGMTPFWVESFSQIKIIDGDVDLAPGVRAVQLPGHTPGSQGVVVNAGERDYLIAGDCVSCHANWDGDERLTHIPSGSFTSLPDYMATFTKIEGLNCEVIPSHDAAVIHRGSFK